MNKKTLSIIIILAAIILASGCSSSIRIGSPGEAKRILTVGAATQDGQITGFSSRGPSSEGYSKPEVVAPGENNIAARAKDTDLGGDLEDMGDFYTSLSGTSMATPQVAGAAAIIIEAYKEKYGIKPTPEFIKAALIAGTRDMEVEGFIYDPIHQGNGMINISKSVDIVLYGEPFIAMSPDIWNVKKLTSVSSRYNNFGEPMYSRGLLPGDTAYQKFVIIPSQSMPNVVVSSSSSWISLDGKSDLDIGDINEDEQPEFIASIDLPNYASSGQYDEYIYVYSDEELKATIPVRLIVAQDPWDIDSENRFYASLEKNNSYYSFDLPKDAISTKINVTAEDDCLGVIVFSPNLDVYIAEAEYDEDSDSYSSIVELPKPASGIYTVALSSAVWDTNTTISNECKSLEATVTIEVYSASISPLNIYEIIEEGESASIDGAIKNTGERIENIDLTSFCGDWDPIEKTASLVYGLLPEENKFTDFEEYGYIDQIYFNISASTQKLDIYISETGEHPTQALLYDPDGEYYAKASNEAEGEPNTSNEAVFAQISNPPSGEWRMEIFNSNITDYYGEPSYFGGEDEVNVEINSSLPCSEITITPTDFEAIDTDGKGIFSISADYPDSPFEGEISFSLQDSEFVIPFTFIPRRGIEEDINIGEAWSYYWLTVPSNAINTTIRTNKSFEDVMIDMFLSSEATGEKTRSIALVENFTYLEEYDAIDETGYISGESMLEYYNDSDADGKLYVFNDWIWGSGSEESATDGNIEVLGSQLGCDLTFFNDTNLDGIIDISSISEGVMMDVASLSETGEYYAGIFMDHIVVFPEGGIWDSIRFDMDSDNNISDEISYSLGDYVTLEDRSFSMPVYQWNPPILYFRENYSIYVGDLSDNNTYFTGVVSLGDIEYSYAAPANGGSYDFVYFDLNEDKDLTNDDPYAEGDAFYIGTGKYNLTEIDIYSNYMDIYLNEFLLLDMGSISDSGDYALAEFEDKFIAIPANDSGFFYEPVYYDSDGDRNFSDEPALNIGDQMDYTDLAPYSAFIYNVDPSNVTLLAEDELWNYIYFSINDVDNDGGDTVSVYTVSIGDDSFNMLRIWNYDTPIYIDSDSDYIFSDSEGPYNVGDIFNVGDYSYEYSDNSPITFRQLREGQTFNLELEPGLWRLLLKAKEGSTGLRVNVEHGVLPVELNLTTDSDVYYSNSGILFNYSIRNNLETDMNITCRIEERDSKYSVYFTQSFDLSSMNPEDGVTSTGNNVMGIPDELGYYYIAMDCTYTDPEEHNLTAVKRFAITDPEDTTVDLTILNSAIHENDNLNYSVDISRDREVPGTLMMYVSEGFGIISSVENSMYVPYTFSSVIPLLDNNKDPLPPGDYTLEAEFSYSIDNEEHYFTDSMQFTIEMLDEDDDGISDLSDKIVGNASFVNSANMDNFSIKVDGNSDLSGEISGVNDVELTEEGNTIVEFDFDFDSYTLDLDEINVSKQDEGATKGYLIISGLDLTSQDRTKTVYIDNIAGKNKLCILDQDGVSSIEEFSSGCTSDDETLINCPSTSSTYNCSIVGDYYKVSGLHNSAVLEYVATTRRSSGGGGGGSFSSFAVINTCKSNITCGDWGGCISGIQTRQCIENCSGNKTTENRNCMSSCTDGLMDNDETDLDCGGGCKACADGKKCMAEKDCQNSCSTRNFTCYTPIIPSITPVEPTCFDGIKNQDEDGIDCGGVCKACDRPADKIAQFDLVKYIPQIVGAIALLGVIGAMLRRKSGEF